MKTLITEFISLDGVVQAPGGPNEDTDGGFAHGGWSMKYFDPVVMYGTYTDLAKQSESLGPAPHMVSYIRKWLLEWADANGYDIYSEGHLRKIGRAHV